MTQSRIVSELRSPGTRLIASVASCTTFGCACLFFAQQVENPEWLRSTIALTGVGLALVVAWLALPLRTDLKSRVTDRSRQAPLPKDFKERFNATQARIREITPDESIIAKRDMGYALVKIINGDITKSNADVLVSSDDNRFQAMGGVASAIVKSGGDALREELSRHDRHGGWRVGDVALTTGGNIGCRAVIHPVLIDLDQELYPTDPSTIATIVRKCLACTAIIGGRSIAFPILGGGTAAKYVDAKESLSTIVRETICVLSDVNNEAAGKLTRVEVYVFDLKDIAGLNLAELLEPTP